MKRDEQTTLAQRLAAHPRFRWAEGMLAVPDAHGCDWFRILRVAEDGTPLTWTDEDSDICDANDMDCETGESFDVFPWLADPATAGCLLVAILTLDPSLHVHCDGKEWIVHVTPGVVESEGATLGDACAVALLRAWGAP